MINFEIILVADTLAINVFYANFLLVLILGKQNCNPPFHAYGFLGLLSSFLIENRSAGYRSPHEFTLVYTSQHDPITKFCTSTNITVPAPIQENP